MLFALLPDPTARARLRAALASGAAPDPVQPRFADSWAELEALVAASAASLLVFDPAPAGKLEPAPIEGYRRRYPCVALLAYAARGVLTVQDGMRLARAGVQEIVVGGESDGPTAFRLIIEGALAATATGQVLAALDNRFPPKLLPWLRLLMNATREQLTRTEAARLYHSHPNTLREHLRAAGLPPVNQMIIWTRLFHAAHLLGDSGRTIENVALTLEFPSVNAMRNQLRHYAGVSPTEVREGGGLAFVIAAFRIRRGL